LQIENRVHSLKERSEDIEVFFRRLSRQFCVIIMLTWLLSLFNLAVLIMALLFAYESHREGEVRAQKVGLVGAGIHFLLGLAILFLPVIRGPLAWFFLIMLPFPRCC
jgi:hypothetical protein